MVHKAFVVLIHLLSDLNRILPVRLVHNPDSLNYFQYLFVLKSDDQFHTIFSNNY